MAFRNFKCNFLPCSANNYSQLIDPVHLDWALHRKSHLFRKPISILIRFTSLILAFFLPCFLRPRIHGAIKQRAFVNSKSHKDVPAQSFSSIWPQAMTLLTPNPQRTGTAAETNAPPKRSPIHNRSRNKLKVCQNSSNQQPAASRGADCPWEAWASGSCASSHLCLSGTKGVGEWAGIFPGHSLNISYLADRQREWYTLKTPALLS